MPSRPSRSTAAAPDGLPSARLKSRATAARASVSARARNRAALAAVAAAAALFLSIITGFLHSGHAPLSFVSLRLDGGNSGLRLGIAFFGVLAVQIGYLRAVTQSLGSSRGDHADQRRCGVAPPAGQEIHGATSAAALAYSVGQVLGCDLLGRQARGYSDQAAKSSPTAG